MKLSINIFLFLISFFFSVLNAKDVIPLDANGKYSNWMFSKKLIYIGQISYFIIFAYIAYYNEWQKIQKNMVSYRGFTYMLKYILWFISGQGRYTNMLRMNLITLQICASRYFFKAKQWIKSILNCSQTVRINWVVYLWK